jgi:hypothetical protein
MKLRTLAAVATLVACGSAPAASPTSSTNPKPDLLTDQTQTTSAQTNEAKPSNATVTTTTAGHRTGDYNTGRARESGEATTPPGKVNSTPGAYPRTPQPAPTNTGDPCGWCKSPNGR